MSKQDICKNLTLLYVEDEDKIRNLLKSAIEDKFQEVITAGNGDEGFKKYKKYQPDIVVSDILMPVCNGLEMSENIRSISKDVPIILFSAFSEKEKLLSAIDIGIDKYLIKPVDIDELLATIENIVSKKLSVDNIIELNDKYSFNKTKHILYKNKTPVKLTKKELSFISLLVDNLGSYVSHDDLKKNVWNNSKVNDAAVRTFIKRIRTKTDKEFIENISGLGYKINS
jgi:DNA-binding response OmpR family regulator